MSSAAPPCVCDGPRPRLEHACLGCSVQCHNLALKEGVSRCSCIQQGVSWDADGSAAEWRGALPALALLRREPAPGAALSPHAPGQRNGTRLHLRLQLPGAGWFGALNFTGSLHDWSWTPHYRSGGRRERGHGWRVVRFAGNAGSERWDFWVDVSAGVLEVDVAAARGSGAVRGEAAGDCSAGFPALPEWVSESKLTTCLSTWRFS